MVGTNLTTSKRLSKTLIADIDMEARPLRTGEVRCNVKLDPYAPKPTFNMELEMAEVPLTKLNDFAKAYGRFTFEEGTLKVATELNSKNGAFTGYVEPVFDHMSIFDPAHDSDNPIDFIWQGIVGGLTRIIRNHPKDRFGTRPAVRQLRRPGAGSDDDDPQRVQERVREGVRGQARERKHRAAEGRQRKTVTPAALQRATPTRRMTERRIGALSDWRFSKT